MTGVRGMPASPLEPRRHPQEGPAIFALGLSQSFKLSKTRRPPPGCGFRLHRRGEFAATPLIMQFQRCKGP